MMDSLLLPWSARYSADLLRAEWTKVVQCGQMRSAPFRTAAYYEPLTTARLTPEERNAVLMADLNKLLGYVVVAFPDFPNYGAGPQQAVLDMTYNLGLTGLLEKFPRCTAAIRAQDWASAAIQSRREPPISEARNAETAALFREGISAGEQEGVA